MIETSYTPISFPAFPRLKTLSHFLPSPSRPSGYDFPETQSTLNSAKERRWALVVDDVSDVTEMLSVLMGHAGFEVSTASSAQDAIALAREHHFDMVISDIGMPEMNGYELAEALRQLPGYDSIPLVAVTGYSMFDDRSRSLAAGFTEHVTKPIDPRAFLNLIEQL
jgi:CheY-like chemotaxis protein